MKKQAIGLIMAMLMTTGCTTPPVVDTKPAPKMLKRDAKGHYHFPGPFDPL